MDIPEWSLPLVPFSFSLMKARLSFLPVAEERLQAPVPVSFSCLEMQHSPLEEPALQSFPWEGAGWEMEISHLWQDQTAL